MQLRRRRNILVLVDAEGRLRAERIQIHGREHRTLDVEVSLALPDQKHTGTRGNPVGAPRVVSQ